MPSIQNFTQATVWQKAHRLALEVYRLTTNFPREEAFGLTSQVRRAAVSVSANIAEGFKRWGDREQRQFYSVAAASLEELRAELLLARDLGYVVNGNVLENLDEVSRLLYAWVRRH